MLPESRRLKIIDIIDRAGSGVVSIADLSQQLDVSDMTIRRDLDYLEERSIVRRVHGGAIAFQGLEHEKTFDDRTRLFDPLKKEAGWTAAQFVKDGDRIIIDAGTTMLHLANQLVTRSRLTIITNNLVVVQELSTCPQIDVVLLGGVFKHREMCTVGGLASQALDQFTADKAFISGAGFSTKDGVTDPDLAESEIKKAMMRTARESILVADSTKYGISALVRVAPFNEFSCLATDDRLSSEAIEEIEVAGIPVYTPKRLVNP